MQTITFKNRLETFECKFEYFKKDSKRSNANLNNSKGIRRIRMQILTFLKGFETFECKFESFEKNSKRLNAN